MALSPIFLLRVWPRNKFVRRRTSTRYDLFPGNIIKRSLRADDSQHFFSTTYFPTTWGLGLPDPVVNITMAQSQLLLKHAKLCTQFWVEFWHKDWDKIGNRYGNKYGNRIGIRFGRRKVGEIGPLGWQIDED